MAADGWRSSGSCRRRGHEPRFLHCGSGLSQHCRTLKALLRAFTEPGCIVLVQLGGAFSHGASRRILVTERRPVGRAAIQVPLRFCSAWYLQALRCHYAFLAACSWLSRFSRASSLIPLPCSGLHLRRLPHRLSPLRFTPTCTDS